VTPPDPASYATVKLTRPRAGILLAALDRPERLNAITFGMFDELARLCREVAADDSVRVLVVSGEGRGFCAGLDLDAAATLATMGATEFVAGQEGWADSIAGFRRLSKPVIAAVNGPAGGAGFALALAADLRLASPSARFNAASVRTGFFGGEAGTSWMLSRIVGLRRAARVLLASRPLDADHAERIGLVSAIYPAQDLRERAFDLADGVIANSEIRSLPIKSTKA
jgi:enoyl-CoA hydratase/carnithine racemase